MVSVLLLGFLSLGLQLSTASSDCAPAVMNAGLCASANISGGDVILEGRGSGGGSGAPDVDGNWADGGASTDPFANCVYVLDSRCLRPGPGRSGDEIGVLQVTWADLAAFRPTASAHAMEPGGWAVVGLPTNFFASADHQIHEGTLLGAPAAVRFTPVGFRWNYGDGFSAGLAQSGTSWAAAGLREFDSTPTSHVFAATGNYTVSLVVDFVAEYRFGASAWTPIMGSIAVASAPLTVSVGTANTVLVDRECTRNSRAPGC